MHTRFHGPYRVVARVGEHSYQVKMADNSIFDVHVSHMKPCVWENTESPCMLTLRIPPLPSEDPDDHQA